MKKFCLLALFFALSLSFKVSAQVSGLPEVTLYAPQKYEHSFKRALFNFETSALVQRGDAEAIDVFVSEEDAHEALDDCLRDEPEWQGLLRIAPIHLDASTNPN